MQNYYDYLIQMDQKKNIRFSERYQNSQKQAENEIENLEKLLEIRMDENFKKFLNEVGYCEILRSKNQSSGLISIFDVKDLLLFNTEEAEQKQIELKMILFGNDCGDFQYSFDTKNLYNKGVNSIVFHHAWDPYPEPISHLGSNFDEFLRIFCEGEINLYDGI